MNKRIVYMTFGNQAEAQRIGKLLVERRLAACVNILGPMQSMYWWDGDVASDDEIAVVAKTVEDRVEALIELVRQEHSYDVPCVVTLPIQEGNPEFLRWMESETREAD